jgi:hypothetical protein
MMVVAAVSVAAIVTVAVAVVAVPVVIVRDNIILPKMVRKPIWGFFLPYSLTFVKTLSKKSPFIHTA